MKDFKGTKGKWVFEEFPKNWFDILQEKSGKNVLRNRDFGNKRLLANAKLIASAPEMFEMLKDIFKYMHNETQFIHKWDIDKLLTKITE
jgi:hypothetical protein